MNKLLTFDKSDVAIILLSTFYKLSIVYGITIALLGFYRWYFVLLYMVGYTIGNHAAVGMLRVRHKK